VLFCGVSDPAEQVSAIKYTHLCHCSAESDAPQDLVLIPRRILFFGVSYPTGKLGTHRIRRKSFGSLPFSLMGRFSQIVCMYKLHYLRLIGCMHKDPPILKMVFVLQLQGMIPCRTTSEFKYLGEFEKKIHNILGHESGAIWDLFMKKTTGQKSRDTVPFRPLF
jgi:hypothetical protein